MAYCNKLTFNADAHPLMNRFHKPTEEKRMVAILPPQHYQDWLDAKNPVMDFMLPFDSELLQSVVPTSPNPTLPSKHMQRTGRQGTRLEAEQLQLIASLEAS